MSKQPTTAKDITLPIKRTTGETLEERLTDNAYHNILPARYLQKDAEGNHTETQEDLFRRVAKNIALAEAVYAARQRDIDLTVTPQQLKPDHPRRDELAAEVFGAGTAATDDTETTLTEYNVNKFSYETVVPELPDEIREHVEDTAAEFQELMESLSFVPNSPTLMNAGGELQQLSACFVMSPDDDISDIHETAKNAAEVFQCLTEDTHVIEETKGRISIAEVKPGDSIVQRTSSGHRFGHVSRTTAYDNAPVRRLTLENGLEITGTRNHKLWVNGEWTELDDVEHGDTVTVRLDWLSDIDLSLDLEPVEAGPQWHTQRTVSNEKIAELHAEGYNDYEVAEILDSAPSTIQHRRANELDLPPNGSGGRPKGRSFDEVRFGELYEVGHSDTDLAAELGVSVGAIRAYRVAESLEPNGQAVKSVTQPRTLSPALAELLGFWVGDGSVHQDGIRFHVSNERVLEHIDRLSRDLFDTGVDWTWASGCYEVVIHSHEIKRWWLKNFGDAKPSSSNAIVPSIIWRADRERVGAFLRGLFTADGTLTKDRYPRLYSASKELIEAAHQLLLGLGIPSTLWEWDNPDRDYYSTAPLGATGIARFTEFVGFIDERQTALAEAVETTDFQSISKGELVDEQTWLLDVVEIEDSETATVYDVTIPHNPEYLADSIVSHNSGGGVGYGFWKLRPYGDSVGSTGGIASGPITFMRTFDQLCETIAQGGTRRGAQMAIMRVSHPDVIEFIHAKNKDVSLAHTLKLNDPDDYTYTSFSEALAEARSLIDDAGRVPKHLRNAVEGHLSNFNISVGITDRFMEALKAGDDYTFTNPRTDEPHIATPETKEMYERYGLSDYVEVGEELSIPAEIIWERIVEGAHENGEPGMVFLERINKEHSFDVEEHPDHQILATNPCVTGDTLISTEHGLIPAEELYEQGVAIDVVVDGRLSEGKIKEASSVFKTGEKDVYKLNTKEGYELRLTADHRVMTDDGWVEAGELGVGDKVHIQNRKGSFGRHGTAEEGRVFGWLIGDGHLKHGEERVVLNFYDEDCELSEDFAQDVNDVIRVPVGNANYDVGVSQIQRPKGYRGSDSREERVRSARLYELAEETGLAADKFQIPDAVLRGSEEMARGFLQALFTADGSVQGTVEKGVSVRLSSSHRELLVDVQRLLLNFGIASKVYDERREAGTKELPDGKGGTKVYDVRAQHELVITKDNLLQFRNEIGFLLESKNDLLDERLGAYGSGPYGERFEVIVESVEYDGHEPVYDLIEPDTHSFLANGLVVHNCGEQPLEEYEACNLGHINLSTLAAEGAPDWRVWSERHADEYATQEAAIEAFLEEAIDWEEFDRRIDLATRFLENVVTMSDFPVPEIEETVRRMRKIGLGIMGLAQLYIQLGMKYGSDESNEVARQVMIYINHGSKATSHDLAVERGAFDDWADSKYADPVSYREWFEHQTGLDADEWADGFPIRNHNTTTIAPTGTTGMVGNTTGGCEPIYNVAYYKNVSDDVQGDEMLVEFDDYFLRVLEANDIDVETVQAEAVEQMESNSFAGIEGLETVPDAIGELFVTTSDITALEHAAVQCACQAGVDSAISKTVNAPNDSSVDDAMAVFEYIYDHGGKGVTYYRDGTRSKQVLTTRADNADFADMETEEAAETLIEQIESIFGTLEGFLDDETVQSEIADSVETIIRGPEAERFAKKRPRPDVLHGTTQRVDTGYGKLYVNINEDEDGRPFELFATIGNSGGFTASFTEALAKIISTALRAGVDPHEIAGELQGIRSPKVAWDKGEQINSIPDAIGTAMRRYLNNEIDRPYPEQPTLEEATAEVVTTPKPADDNQDIIAQGESPECPDCGSFSLYYTEGCKTCDVCGWSEC